MADKSIKKIVNSKSINRIKNLGKYAVKGEMIKEKHPFYGKHHSKKSREKMSFSHIGKKQPHTEETKIKIGLANKGRIMSKEIREKSRLSHLGIKHSEETKRKLSLIRKGTRLSEETKNKLRESKLGEKNPMFGKIHTEEYKNKLRGLHSGWKQSKDAKEKMRISKLGKKNPMYGKFGKENPMYGKKFSEEHRKKLIIARSTRVLPKKDTTIEIKIQEFLSRLHKEYFTHKYMKIEHGYQCDILIPIQEGIPQPTIIECDGDAFHFNPKKYNKDSKIFKDGMNAGERWKLDEARTNELIEKGFRVIRLWENEIKIMSLNNLKEILKNEY